MTTSDVGRIVGSRVGANDGIGVGNAVGSKEGTGEGRNDGTGDGIAVGRPEGAPDGSTVGIAVGSSEGSEVGVDVGIKVGTNDGNALGTCVGSVVGSDEGAAVGAIDGIPVGTSVGTAVGVKQSVPMRLPVLMSAPTMYDAFTMAETERGKRPQRSLSFSNKYAVRSVSRPNSVGIAGYSMCSATLSKSGSLAGLSSLSCKKYRLCIAVRLPSCVGMALVSSFDASWNCFVIF